MDDTPPSNATDQSESEADNEVGEVPLAEPGAESTPVKEAANQFKRWKPVAEVVGILVAIVASFASLTLSLINFFDVRSDLDTKISVGPRFGIAVIDRSQVLTYGVPMLAKKSGKNLYLIIDCSCIFLNDGGRPGRIEWVTLEIHDKNSDRKIELDWSVFFERPSVGPPVLVGLVAPFAVRGKSIEERFIRFRSHPHSDLRDFIVPGHEYEFTFTFEAISFEDSKENEITDEIKLTCTLNHTSTESLEENVFRDDESLDTEATTIWHFDTDDSEQGGDAKRD